MTKNESNLSVSDIKTLINLVSKTKDLSYNRNYFNEKSLEVLIYELKHLLSAEGGALGTCTSSNLGSSKKQSLCSWNNMTVLANNSEIVRDMGVCENSCNSKWDIENKNSNPNSFVSCMPQKNELISCLYLEYNNNALNQKEENIIDIILPYIHSTIHTYYEIINNHNLPKFTKREEEVIKWICAGKDNWSISRILDISERTVKFHNNNIYRKLNVATRLEAVSKLRNIEH